MDLQRIKQTARELEGEMRRVSASVAVYEIDEMKAKLSELADAAGSIAEQLSETQIEGFDAIREAMNCEVTNG